MKRLFLCSAVIAMTLPLWAGNGNTICATLATSSKQAAAGAYASSFSATKIIDLNVSVLFTQPVANKLTGDHSVEVKIYTPAGNLYQSISVPFTYEKGKKGQKRRLRGYPEPVAVEVLTETEYNRTKYYGLKVTLPVAGTPIMNNSLYGRWSAEALLDGDVVSCGQLASFSISQ